MANDDLCEDVIIGIKKVSELTQKLNIKRILHIGDWPLHGDLYYKNTTLDSSMEDLLSILPKYRED